MKKSLVLGILGLTTAALSSYGQGNIFLDNYLASSYNPILVNGAKATPTITIWGPWGTPYSYSVTVGMYYDPIPGQNVTAAFNAAMATDPAGIADPSALNSALIPATGAGSTATILTSSPGYFTALGSFSIQPSGTPSTFTIVVVAWAGGSSYDSALIRGYSEAVQITAAAPSVPNGGDVGRFFPEGTFGDEVPMIQIWLVPEPATFALAGLGGLALWLLRRKKT